MKKVKFLLLGILSILLISPVVAEDTNLRNPYLNTYISHESLKSNYNITYGFYLNKYSRSAAAKRENYFFDSNLNMNFNIGYFNSISTQSGDIVDTSISPFGLNGSNYSIFNSSDLYYPLLGIGGSNNVLDPSRVSLYFQSNSTQVQNSGNKLLRFVGSNPTGPAYVGIINSYIRLLYNYSNSSDLWFFNSDFPTSTAINPATSIQLFQFGANTFNTEKGRFSVNGQTFSHVVSSVGNGFSFIPVYNTDQTYYRDDLKFYSVFPGRDVNTAFNLPTSKYTNNFFMFKYNSFKRNSPYDEIGVLSKCTPSLCAGISDLTTYLSSLVFSDYICDFSSSYNFKDNCILGGGGILVNVLGNITGLNTPIDFSNNGFFYQLFTTTNFAVATNDFTRSSVGISFNLGSSPYSLTISSNYQNTIYTSYFQSNSYNISYTGGYTLSNNPDILGLAEYDVPDSGGGQGGGSSNIPIELNTGSISDLIRQRCVNNSSFYNLNKDRCNRLGVGFGAGGSEIPSYINGGETCLKIIQFLDDQGNMVEKYVNCDEDLSDGMYVDSSGNVYFYNSGYYQHTNYFQSGLVQSGFYEDSNSWFFSCPYPVNFQSGSKFVEFFANSNIGSYNLGLPLVCFYGAFQAGKTYNFLSGVNLGLSPLMLEIQGPNDPRNYLYRFLDFLLSLGLFFFLVKFYHFFK